MTVCGKLGVLSDYGALPNTAIFCQSEFYTLKQFFYPKYFKSTLTELTSTIGKSIRRTTKQECVRMINVLPLCSCVLDIRYEEK